MSPDVSTVNPPQSVLRRHELPLSGAATRLPVFFPSVSSVKTNLSPLAYVQVLNLVFKKRQYLISAYDLMRADEALRALWMQERAVAASDETIVLMDSGNYESFWREPSAPWTADEYHDALHAFKPDMAFGFDNQSPPSDESLHLKHLLDQYDSDRLAGGSTLVIPIIHGASAHIAQLCVKLVKASFAQYIAVPERCLGANLLDRVRTVSSIRRALDTLGSYVCLHLLGTGNPLSLALFAGAGADSFDGLEWCQTSVDYESKLLHHFSQGVLFLHQGRWADSNSSYEVRTLAHNLDFFADWNDKLRQGVEERSVEKLINETYSFSIFDKCKEAGLWK